MRVLIIGDGNSVWVQNYIKFALIPYNSDVTLLTKSIKSENDLYFYNDNKIKLTYYTNNIPLIRHIPKVRAQFNLMLTVKKLRQLDNFDGIHVHFIDKHSCKIATLLRNNANKIIFTYWGSDLLRRPIKQLRKMTKYLKFADEVTMSTQTMIDKFKDAYGNAYNSKIHKILFGITMFDSIDEINARETQQKSKELLGIPQDKIIAVIGYNASESQQHYNVIEQIEKLPLGIRESLFVILPMTYGKCTNDYINQLGEQLSKTQVESKIITEYMDDEVVARIRRVADIFINAQKTDAFSATVQEFIYAQGIVLNASWLKYDDLIKANINIIEFDSFETLAEVLNNTIVNLPKLKEGSAIYKNTIRDISSWDSVSDSWYKLYTSL